MSMENRVALCLFGQMRTFDRCFQYISENLIDPLSPDIFIHTWKEGGLDETTITYDLLDNYYAPSASVIEEFEEQYYETLDGVQIPEDIKSLDPWAKSILPLFYKINRVVELKRNHEVENGISYDAVILTRPDIAIADQLPKAVLSQSKHLWVRPTNPYYLCDQLCVSNSTNIDEYASIWDSLQEYLDTGLGDEYGPHGEPDTEFIHHSTHIGNPERLVYHHIKQSNINVRNFQIRSEILRLDDSTPYFERSLPVRLLHILRYGTIQGSRSYPYSATERAAWVFANEGFQAVLRETGTFLSKRLRFIRQ